MKKYSIIYVDDIPNICTFKLQFRKKYNVLIAKNGSEALKLLKQHEVQMVIADQWLPDMHGVALLGEVLKRNSEVITVFLSSYSDSNIIEILMKDSGIHYCLIKPFEVKQLESIIDLEKRKMVI